MPSYRQLAIDRGALYAQGSPVLVEARALVIDDETGALFAQVKLRNVETAPVADLYVEVVPTCAAGEAGPATAHAFRGVSAAPGVPFGQRVPIPLDSTDAEFFDVRVTRVVLEGGGRWEAPADARWLPLPAQGRLLDAFTADDAAEYALRLHGNDLVPAEVGDLWLCSCGRPNKSRVPVCPGCGNARADVLVATGAGTMAAATAAWREERLAAEARRAEELAAAKARWAEKAARRAEADRLEREARDAEARKMARRVAMVAVPAAVAIVLANQLYFAPKASYDAGVAALERGDAATAAKRFEAAGSYADAPQRLEEALALAPAISEAEAILRSDGDLRPRVLEAAKIYVNAGPEYETEYNFCMGISYLERGHRTAASRYLEKVPDGFELCGLKASDFKSRLRQ